MLIQAIRKKQVPGGADPISSAVGVLMMASQGTTLPFFLDRIPTSTRYQEALASACCWRSRRRGRVLLRDSPRPGEAAVSRRAPGV